MKVIVMQSVAGDSTVASVYTQDREGIIYIFAIIYLLALCLIGGKQGLSKDSPCQDSENYRILFFIIGPMIIAMIIFTRSAGMNGITQTARAAWKV